MIANALTSRNRFYRTIESKPVVFNRGSASAVQGLGKFTIKSEVANQV